MRTIRSNDTPRIKSKRRQVYPYSWVETIIIPHSLNYSLAIECWAMTLNAELDELIDYFTPEDWEVMKLSVSSLNHPNSEVYEPQTVVANIVATADKTVHVGKIYGNQREKKVNELVAKIKQLDYVQAWAVINAILWAREHNGIKEWWRGSSRKLD